MSTAVINRIGRQKPTNNFLSTAVPAPLEIIRHAGQGADAPRVLHVWASPGQYHTTRPFIQGTLYQEANGITRVEKVQIPWSGRAFQLLPGEVWLELLVQNSGGSPPLTASDVIRATIAHGYAAAGVALGNRGDSITGAFVMDAEDPNTGCEFATSLIVSGHGGPTPFVVTYSTGAAVNGTDQQTLEIDWRSKVTISPFVQCSVSAMWRFFR